MPWLLTLASCLASLNIPFTRGNQAFTPGLDPTTGGRKWGKYINPTAEWTWLVYLWEEDVAWNNNANPDKEIQLPCVWSGPVVNRAAADIMWIDAAQTTSDGGWEAAGRRMKSRGTRVWWCSLRCNTEQTESEARSGCVVSSCQQMKQLLTLVR